MTNQTTVAAQRVIELYRAEGWDALAGATPEGGHVELRELEEALGALEGAISSRSATEITDEIHRRLRAADQSAGLDLGRAGTSPMDLRWR
jgi:hypothetical protein